MIGAGVIESIVKISLLSSSWSWALVTHCVYAKGKLSTHMYKSLGYHYSLVEEIWTQLWTHVFWVKLILSREIRF